MYKKIIKITKEQVREMPTWKKIQSFCFLLHELELELKQEDLDRDLNHGRED